MWGKVRQTEGRVCGRGGVTVLRGSKISRARRLGTDATAIKAPSMALMACPAIRGRALLDAVGISKNP
ncbi:MAG: hypothetical protein HFJ05_11745 [Eubacterium sp.]|nr:hypothetical protein [Eubacterium sp.]